MSTNQVSSCELVDFVKTLPCVHCGKYPAGDTHHVKTRGSGGGDISENLMPLCRTGHTEIHQQGLTTFAERNGGAREWLRAAGWKLMAGKWRRVD